MSESRKTYTEEFKCEAVRLMENSDNKSAVARDRGHLSLLREWLKKIHGGEERLGVPRKLYRFH